MCSYSSIHVCMYQSCAVSKETDVQTEYQMTPLIKTVETIIRPSFLTQKVNLYPPDLPTLLHNGITFPMH